MSLINEALKKAQRLRNEGASSDTAPVPGGAAGGKIAKRGQARSANTMVLIGGGALLLVLVSVALTVYLLNRPTAPTAPPVAVAPVTAPVAPTPAPVVSTPAPTNPVVGPPVDPAATAPAPVVAPQTEKAPAPTVVETKPAAATPPAPQPTIPAPTTAPVTATAPTTTASAPPAPVATAPTPTPAPASAPVANARPDDRVTAFVESVKVTGIRSSGTESRVLMNERVYRVNDIVDRALGVRLIKVAVDSLTFSDTNGVSYIKYF